MGKNQRLKVHRQWLPGRSLCSIRSNRKWCKRRGSSLECQNCFFVYPIIDSNLKNFINSRIKNSIYVYCPVNYFKFLTKNTCLSIEFKLCFCKFFCKEIFMNISPVCKTSVSFPFLVSVFL